ncbi:MAG: response regulator, partial [Brevundimonas sp.]
MPLPSTRIGLRAVEPLIVDDSTQSLEMMSALMMGFGVSRST